MGKVKDFFLWLIGVFRKKTVQAPADFPSNCSVPQEQEELEEPINQMETKEMITIEIARQMFPFAHYENIVDHFWLIIAALEWRGIADNQMALMALSTIRAETEPFYPLEEGISQYNTSSGGDPFNLYDFRTDLGNGKIGDGNRYKGRGFVQLTGKDNYQRYGEAIGLGSLLLAHPELACEPWIASQLLAQFLKSKEKGIRKALGENDYTAARKLVNGGSHGLDRFVDAFQRGEAALQS